MIEKISSENDEKIMMTLTKKLESYISLNEKDKKNII
jgi:hypothetical protein